MKAAPTTRSGAHMLNYAGPVRANRYHHVRLVGHVRPGNGLATGNSPITQPLGKIPLVESPRIVSLRSSTARRCAKCVSDQTHCCTRNATKCLSNKQCRFQGTARTP